MKRRWTVLALIGMVALGASPFADPEYVRRLEAENKLLKAQVDNLKRRLADKNPLPPATRPAVPTFRTPKDCWTNPDSFIEHVRIRDILGLRNPKESPQAWLDKNKGFAGKAILWRGTRGNAISWPMKKLAQVEVSAGKIGNVTLTIMRGVHAWKDKKGDSVTAEGIIEKIEIRPAEIKDGQIVHGAIMVQIQGGIRPSPRGRKVSWKRTNHP